MYNFHNLNDFEFEVLCKDIMEKKLGVKLRIFGKGPDGGIDLTDNIASENIVIQVKHYINSTFANLRTSLRKEIDKIEKLNLKKYYVCCAMELSPSNIKEIYNMFSKHMESDENIITLTEINEFLEKEENSDIIRKNYKLWLESTNILSEIYNQNIFIDCDSLIYDIENEYKYFVETECYKECMKKLSEHKILFLLGHPGVGKTTTTKMLALFWASKGYKIRYTSNGKISDLKKSISANREVKEILLLDDCLGQHYFNMKESVENELLYLVKYISKNPNKMLILNSRVTIFNEAKKRSNEFEKFIGDEKIKITTIDMDKLSIKDKGIIFYNHLFVKGIPDEYYKDIKKDKNYKKIVNHSNYTPRIIEFATSRHNYKNVLPNNYYEYILELLNYPDKIWEDEFIKKLEEEDRILMSTLYSLTDTSISYDKLKRAYNYRIDKVTGLDTTINIFDGVINRLSGSLIIIYDKKHKKEIGVINPSVNDYLKNYINSNELEMKKIISNIIEYCQIEKMIKDKDEMIYTMLKNKKIFQLFFENEIQKEYVIMSSLCVNKFMDKQYEDIVSMFLQDLSDCSVKGAMSCTDIICALLKEPLFSYYNVEEYFEYGFDEFFFQMMTFEEINEFMIKIEKYDINIDFVVDFKKILKNGINLVIENYLENIDVEDYYDYDYDEIVEGCLNFKDGAVVLDYSKIIDRIKVWIKEDIVDEIKHKIEPFSKWIYEEILIDQDYIKISESSIIDYVKSFFESDDSDDEYGHNYSSVLDTTIDILDIIFE